MDRSGCSVFYSLDLRTNLSHSSPDSTSSISDKSTLVVMVTVEEQQSHLVYLCVCVRCTRDRRGDAAVTPLGTHSGVCARTVV